MIAGSVPQVTEAAELNANLAAAGVQPSDGFGGTANGTAGGGDGAGGDGGVNGAAPPPPPEEEDEAEELDADELFSRMPMAPGVPPAAPTASPETLAIEPSILRL